MTEPHIDYTASRAVLIGTSRYDDRRFFDVPAVANSLHGVYSALTDPRLGGWPESRVERWLNPTDGSRVARQFRQLATAAEDVLFFYFVGHGKISRYQELCLILADSDFDNPDLTGLEFGRVRRVVEESRARVKIVILDCCDSSRALSGPAEVLSAVEVSELVEITGTYTLVATNPASKLARVSALTGERDNTATAFTRELLELIYEGRPGSPPYLTLRDIHDPLLSRLSALSLPA